MSEHLSLTEFLSPLVSAVKAAATSQWVAAEIAEVREPNHLYITLIESDDDGKKCAELRVQIWAAGKAKLLTRFEQGTGGEKLRKGLKVMLKLRPALSPVFGLSATVEDINPSFTLGEAARKLIELRERLVSEGIYDNQRRFPPPNDFTNVAVICPAGAAGLGDFKSHADPLEDVRLCAFTYYPATFQGDRTSETIVDALRNVYRSHRDSPFDAVIILRGGGSQADLAWLNDYAISSAITKMPLPVFVAIGHERDQTILDEIGNVSFHTPSKAIGHIAGTILGNGQRAINDFESIIAAATKSVTMTTHGINHIRELIESFARQAVTTAAESVGANRNTIVAGAHHAIELTRSAMTQQIGTVKDSAYRNRDTAERETNDYLETVGSATTRSITAAEHGLARAREVIHGAATKGIAVAETIINGHRLLVRDRSILYADRTKQDLVRLGQIVDDNARRDIAAVQTDIDGQRLLIRDRSLLGVKTLRDFIKADAEFVIGIGPKKTLARGFSMTKKKGKAVTRKAQVAKGDLIEVDFADGNVEAVVQ